MLASITKKKQQSKIHIWKLSSYRLHKDSYAVFMVLLVNKTWKFKEKLILSASTYKSWSLSGRLVVKFQCLVPCLQQSICSPISYISKFAEAQICSTCLLDAKRCHWNGARAEEHRWCRSLSNSKPFNASCTGHDRQDNVLFYTRITSLFYQPLWGRLSINVWFKLLTCL